MAIGHRFLNRNVTGTVYSMWPMWSRKSHQPVEGDLQKHTAPEHL